MESSFGVTDQVGHTHLVTSDYSIPDNDIKQAVFHTIKLLYGTLKERLNVDPVNSLAHPYVEHNDISSVYLELKAHPLAFTIEQLSMIHC
jgi:hypothetical protein